MKMRRTKRNDGQNNNHFERNKKKKNKRNFSVVVGLQSGRSTADRNRVDHVSVSGCRNFDIFFSSSSPFSLRLPIIHGQLKCLNEELWGKVPPVGLWVSELSRPTLIFAVCVLVKIFRARDIRYRLHLLADQPDRISERRMNDPHRSRTLQVTQHSTQFFWKSPELQLGIDLNET